MAGKNMKFRLKRKDGAPPIDNQGGELVGLEFTVNVAGWPLPQVVPALLDAESVGNFVGAPGADNGTFEVRLVDNDGNRSVTPITKTFSLPDTVPPGTPDDIFDLEIMGEEEVAPPEPAMSNRKK